MRKSSCEHGVRLDLVGLRKMFDWEDQELAIIWGEADDHIVPYPAESERKSQAYFVSNGTHEEPANRKEIDLEKDFETSKDQNEAGELNDIINNSWANIGSFDDLDRIFSSLDGNWLPPDINLQTFESQSIQDKSKSYSASVPEHGNTPHQHITNPYFPAYSYGTDDELHHVSTDESSETLMKRDLMTPKEKIEKLRKRHQIQALLGIKKQQQQLSSEDNKVSHFARDDLDAEENMGTICDSGSPLYQLQNVVNELDMNIRLCIRDSLYRLAESATQRNYANSHGDFNASILKEDISNGVRFMEIPCGETETNCIDRAIAQLLFHQPLKSTSNQTDTSMNLKLKQKMVENAD